MAEAAPDWKGEFINRLIETVLSAEHTSPKVIETSPEVLHNTVTTLLSKLTRTVLNYVEERLRSYCKELLAVGVRDAGSLKDIIYKCSYMENYLMQTYRNKISEEQPMDVHQSVQGDLLDSRNTYLHQEVLTKFLPDFLENVNLDGTTIMDSLISDQLMTEDERESIVRHNKTSRRRKDAFIHLMKGRLSQDTLMKNFIPAIELDHPKVAERLKATTLELQNYTARTILCAFCNMKQVVKVKYLAEHLHDIISTDLYDDFRNPGITNSVKWSTLLSAVGNPLYITEAIKSKFPSVHERLIKENCANLECKCTAVQKAALLQETTTDATSDVANIAELESVLDNMSVYFNDTSQKLMKEYKMGSRVRGMAILINNKAANDAKETQRLYDLDTKALENILREKGFVTQIHTNLTTEEMKTVVQKAAATNHEAYDAFVCVFHCEQNYADGNSFLLDALKERCLFQEFKNLFKASQCPTLAGKPKIFFLPSGVKDNSMKGEWDVGDEADFLIVRATAPGYGVLDGFNCSAWVHVFQEVFRRYSESQDMVSLLTIVADQIGSLSIFGSHDYKQTPHIESTLRKGLFLRSSAYYSAVDTLPLD